MRNGAKTAASISVSDRDDDLADLPVRLQIAVGLDDFLKRKRFSDERLDAAVGQSVVHELFRPFQALRVARGLHHHVAHLPSTSSKGSGVGSGLNAP